MRRVEYEAAFEEWQAVHHPTQRQRVQFRLWAYECAECGLPLDDCVSDPFEDGLLIYWHPLLKASILLDNEQIDGDELVTVLSIDPI